MKNNLFLLLLITFCGQPNYTSAQPGTQAPTSYQVYAYMKVAPGMEDDYIKMEQAYKKIHAASQKAGKLQSWSLTQVIGAGTNSAYNYVAKNGFLGDDQLAAFLDGNFDIDLSKLLTEEEMELVKRTDQIRSLVKSEVWSGVDILWTEGGQKANIAVYNYFKSPEGKTVGDHVKMEKEIWRPVHEARIKDGKMVGWVLSHMEMPYGSEMPYEMMTVDLYTDMRSYLEPWFDQYFLKVHAGKDIGDLEKQTSDATTLLRGEHRRVIDRLEALK